MAPCRIFGTLPEAVTLGGGVMRRQRRWDSDAFQQVQDKDGSRRLVPAMREVLDGCKICGKRMLTDRSPLIHRTCDACKAEQRRAHNSKMAARRKAERHAAKQAMEAPRCQHCGKPIKGAERVRKERYGRAQWVRKFCSNACRQATFRANG